MNTGHQEPNAATQQYEYYHDTDYEVIDSPGRYGHDQIPRAVPSVNEPPGGHTRQMAEVLYSADPSSSSHMPWYPQQNYPATDILDAGGKPLYWSDGQYQESGYGPRSAYQSNAYNDIGYQRGGTDYYERSSYQTGTQSMKQTAVYDEPAEIQSLGNSMDILHLETPSTQNRGQMVKHSISKDRRVRRTTGDYEELDASYKTRNKDYKAFFSLGRVFKTLWTEPYAGGDSHSRFPDRSISDVPYGQKVYSKIRRFVVIRYVDRYSICLPVTTYDGRGYMKRGINLSHHGLVHTTEQPPENPSGISLRPVKLTSSTNERLMDPSLINYARQYSVECNIKVKDGGRLSEKSCGILIENYRYIQMDFDVDEHSSHSDRIPFASSMLAGVGAAFLPQLSKPNTIGLNKVNSAESRSATPSEFERISRPSRFFVLGRVFKVHWAELAGGDGGSGVASSFLISAPNGEKIFHKIRRFVVVRQMQDHCMCLPLNTYNQQGTLKKGVDPNNHAAVFAAGTPEPDTSAEQLQKAPFPILIESSEEAVHSMSRINFGRVYTVEYNVPVANVGRIHQDHIDRLNQYFVQAINQDALPPPDRDSGSDHEEQDVQR